MSRKESGFVFLYVKWDVTCFICLNKMCDFDSLWCVLQH